MMKARFMGCGPDRAVAHTRHGGYLFACQSGLAVLKCRVDKGSADEAPPIDASLRSYPHLTPWVLHQRIHPIVDQRGGSCSALAQMQDGAAARVEHIDAGVEHPDPYA